MKGLDELMRMAIAQKEQEVVLAMHQGQMRRAEEIRTQEKRAVEERYSGYGIGRYNDITLLENKLTELREKLNIEIGYAIKARFPKAFKEEIKTVDAYTIHKLRSDINEISGFYEEYHLACGSIASLQKTVGIWAMKIRACDNLTNADRVAEEMTRDYNNKVINVQSGINLASQKMVEKIGVYMQQQNVGAQNEVAIVNNPVALPDNNTELLKQQLTKTLQDNENLRKKDAGITKQNTELKKEKAVLEKTNANLEKTNANLEEEKLEARQEKKYWQEKTAKTKAKKLVVEADNSKLKTEKSELEDLVAKLTAKLALAKKTLTDIGHPLAALDIDDTGEQIEVAIIGNNEAGGFVEGLIN